MAKPEKPATVPCRICAEGIQAKALKCIHCDSYQDWRRHLNFSATVLSLLVALISVIGATAPTLAKIWFPPRESSSLRFAFQGADSSVISAFVSNSGNRPALVSYAVLFVGDARMDDPKAYRLETIGSDGVGLVVPGHQIMLMNFTMTGRAAIATPPAKGRCSIALEYTNFDSSQNQWNQFIPCERLAAFIALRGAPAQATPAPS